ncbi:MAG TPA: SMP-30/gluconolactonase/LRE family protein [Candidatus Binatia bacterium]|nr:SMP-30/gluconolactonase/LRE family protein [Candidatus Binatia bacterium]
MKRECVVSLFFVFVLYVGSALVWADPPSQFPQNATFTTLITTPRAIEGLTGDNHRNLYTGGSGAPPCPVWQINIHNPKLIEVGFVVPASGNCGFSGIAFDEAENLYVADGAAGIIYFFNPNTKNPPTATIFAQGVPGTNGLAFDRRGNLWTGDGTTGQGRVWKITSPGANCTPPTPVNCVEVFRIQPMANELDPATTGGVSNVGRDVRTLPPGTITVTPTSRNASNMLGSQALVANGLAFNKNGDLFNIDTARGALWKIEFDGRGELRSPTGCDTTFTRNTLCLSNVFVAHPILEGGDGIALDLEGNIWVDANERNAVALVTKDRRVFEVFRNPVNSAGSRNSADTAEGNTHILEFPNSPFLMGRLFCTSQSDGNRRDNFPNTAGQVSPTGPNIGKISCMDQELTIPGLHLPVR